MRVLIINSHPDRESFCFALADKYMQVCKNRGVQCNLIHLMDLHFDPILKYGYRMPTGLEPDLIKMQELILAANHIVFVFPVWWGTYPALLKGFIDRVFLPGFAFKYKPGSLLWEKKLIGKTATIIATMDTPLWYSRLVYKSPAINSLKKGVLEFCGIKPVNVKFFSPIKSSTPAKREKWLRKVEQMGLKLK